MGQQGGIFRPWGEGEEREQDKNKGFKKESSASCSTPPRVKQEPPAPARLSHLDIAFRGLEQRLALPHSSAPFSFPPSLRNPFPFPPSPSPSLEQLSHLMRLSNSLAGEDLVSRYTVK